MKLFRILLGFAGLLFLTACGEEDDIKNYVGRWSLESGSEILQVSAIEDNTLQIDRYFLTSLNSVQKSTLIAKIEDGDMKVGEGMLTMSYHYNEKENRIIGRSGAYRPVPEGWLWKDGYDGLEG